ncbi:hypothetical protein TTHERM_00521980 (macronuclear) [Tetrahymena thermophila SB210]|uniref:Uncharacterized protein n=1 Tax=Tetrahymena thermophila (strain SB210) TaxID=312017 RepID=I7ME27_TETTS|nr:hypothetical protein TTHERM_00521980 [Tetrahymena thermophila SB210]EAR94131.2 hypothetical protein TTHERM_00521980 [Tetrahymena thermophila SB210]|eukprot:XP_001014376.2 hypothetical protein TTHERM_00521980 [Tetrahymena thermophila SB210]
MTPITRSSQKARLERSSSNIRSPPQLGQSSSAASLLNYRMSQQALGKSLGSQSRLRFDKENEMQRKQRDMSADTLQKRLDTFFASTRNFIYSSTKMKNSMVEVIKEVDQQIDFNIKLFETDKQSLERCLNTLQSQLFNIKDSTDINFRSTANPFSNSKTAFFSRQQESLAQTQNLTDNIYLNQLRRENKNLKYEMQNLKEEIDKLNIEKIQKYKSQDQFLASELESLQKQVIKIEKKATERKVCIKKLYSLLENKEKELEEFRNYQQKYPLGAVVNMISQIKKHDSSKKMQNYVEMAIKEVKLNNLLHKEGDTYSKQKRVEIEEMIHFLKVEQKEVIKYFASLVQGQQVNKLERQLSPSSQINQNFIGKDNISPKNQQQDLGNGGVASSLQFIRSNGFSQQNQPSRNGSQLASPNNFKSQLSISNQNFMKSERLSPQQQQILPVSPTNKLLNASLGQGFNKDDFEYVLKEQVEYVRKKYLTHFVEMLAQLGIHTDNLNLSNQSDEAPIILKLREEFQKIATKHTGYSQLVQELRQRIETKEKELIEKCSEIDNLKVKVIKVQEEAESNPKIDKLEEQVQQFKQEIRAKNEEKKQAYSKIQQLEEINLENERRERLYLEDLDRLRDDLFMVLDNLKNILEYFGIIDANEERNVDRMLDTLRQYLEKQADKVFLHKNVFEDMEKKIIDNQEEVEILKQQNGEFAKQIDDLEEINRTLKDQLEIISLKNEEGDKLEQGIRDKIIQLQNENHILKKNQIAPELFEKMQQENREAQNELNERNEVIINMKMEIQSLEQKLQEKEKQIKKIQSEMVEVEEEKIHQAKLVKSLEQFQVDKKARNEEILEKVIEMEKIQKKLNKRNIELEEELKKYKETEINLEVQIEKAKKQGDEKTQDLQKKIKDFEKQNQQSNQKIGELKEQIATLQSQISNLQHELQQEKDKNIKQEMDFKKSNENDIAQLEFSLQKQIKNLQQEKEDAVNAERLKYEKEIQAIRRQDESEEYISEEKYQKLLSELNIKDQQVKQLQQQLQEQEIALQESKEALYIERQKLDAQLQEQLKNQSIELKKVNEQEIQNVVDQFEKILKDKAAQFEQEKSQKNEAFEKELKQIQNRFKEHEEEINRENKRVVEVNQMELNGLKENNEELQSLNQKLEIELKQAQIRENELQSENENLKTKIELIESNASSENKTIVNGLQTEKRQIEQNLSQAKRNLELSEKNILELKQKITKLEEENESISLERSNLIKQLQGNQDEINDVKQDNQQKQSELAQHIQQKDYYIQELENEITNLKSKIDQSNQETQIITQESIQLNHKISELQQLNQEKEKRIEQISKKAEEAIIQLQKEHQQKIEEVIHQSKGEILEGYNKQRAQLEQQIVFLNQQNEQTKQSFEKQIHSLQNEKEQQKISFENQKEQQRILFEQEKQQLAKQFESQKEQNKNALEKQINELNEKLNSSKNKYESEIQAINKEYNKKIQDTVEQTKIEMNQTFSQQIKKLEQQLNDLTRQNNEFKQNNNELQKQIQSNQVEAEQKVQQLKQNHQKQLDQSINQVTNEITESFKQQIATLEKQINLLKDTQAASSQNQTSKFTQEINSLSEQIVSLQQENQVLNQHKRDLDSLNQKLQQNIQEIQENLNQSQKNNIKLESIVKDSQQKLEQQVKILEEEKERYSLIEKEKQSILEKNNQLENQMEELKRNLQQFKVQVQQTEQKQENEAFSKLQNENNDLVQQNNSLLFQINELNNQIHLLEDKLQKSSILQGKQITTENQQGEEIFDFEDFADELAASQNAKDKSRQDKEKKSEMVADSGKFKLNFASIQNNFDNDKDRMQIKRDMQQQQQIKNKEANDYFVDDDDDFDDSNQEKDKFKDQIIQEQGIAIEGQKNEISELKNQIDMMFQDINSQREYIQYLESLVDEYKQKEQQNPLNINEFDNQGGQQQEHFVEQSDASPNTKILNLKSKLADVQENHETEILNLNQQLIALKEEIKGLKNHIADLMQANDDLELRIEEKENQILQLHENQQDNVNEEQIGVLQEQIQKLQNKLRRQEEDMAYLQQVNQNLNKQIDEYMKKLKMKQPGSESGQSKDDEEYEGGLVQQLGKTQQQQQQQPKQPQQQQSQKAQPQQQLQQQSKKDISQNQIGSYNDMQDQDFENDQDEEETYQSQKPKILNTQEAEQFQAQLINEKIQLQQQLAELKNDNDAIQTEDQIQIQQIQKRLEHNKKQLQLVQEMASNRNKEKYEFAQLKEKHLHLTQQFKELKEETENLKLENQNYRNQLGSKNASPQINSMKPDSKNQSVTSTEQLDMLKLSLMDAQTQLKSMKDKYQKGIKRIKQMIEAPSFSASQPAETEEDIVALADQLVASHQQKIQQIQLQLQHTLSEGISSHKSPQGNKEDDFVEENEGKTKITDITSLKAYILYSQKLELIIEEALLNKMLAQNDQQNRKDLTSEQYEKVQQYLHILSDFQQSLQEKEKEYNDMQDKLILLAEENEKLKKSDSSSNRNILQKPKSMQQKDPFQINDFENIQEEIPNPINNQGNESSFLSMSEQIIKELEGANNTKTPQQQVSMQQQSQVQKQHEEDLNKLMKENSELKASKEYFASRQDELYDELRAKDEIIQNNELYVKNLKKEIRKLKESTEAVSQKEQLKIIFIKFIQAMADKKKQLEADNFLAILFSMLGVTDQDKEEIINSLAKKPADKKKTIIQLLTLK